jgi:hypothetical protein
MRLHEAIEIQDRGYLSPCWIWQRYTDRKGYGIQRAAGSRRAHRISYETFRGSIPQGLTIDHLCRVPACVNPVHLEPVTFAENTRRNMSPSHIAHRTGRCRKGHTLSYRRTSGMAYCNACQRARYAAKAVA